MGAETVTKGSRANLGHQRRELTWEIKKPGALPKLEIVLRSQNDRPTQSQAR
jgi:hypothetical protein